MQSSNFGVTSIISRAGMMILKAPFPNGRRASPRLMVIVAACLGLQGNGHKTGGEKIPVLTMELRRANGTAISDTNPSRSRIVKKCSILTIRGVGLVHYFRNETHAKAGYGCSLPDLRRGSWSEV